MNCRPLAHWSRGKCVWRWKFNGLSVRQTSAVAPRDVNNVLKPYFITTPIFYPNSDPHIGHLYSTVIADILARYARLKTPSRPAVFITGTDEHGAKIQKAAHDNGYEGRELEFCDWISQRFRDLTSKANLSHTRFIRTTEPDHAVAVHHLWRELKSRGYIYKGTHSGWYSISDECFYTPSQVESVTDPKTGEPNMVSKETKNLVEWSEEENYKFRLSDFRERLLDRYTTEQGHLTNLFFPAPVLIDSQILQTAIVPQGQLDLIRGLLTIPENANDISISRPSTRLKWGIPVPDDPQHVIYVWLEALAAYLTAVGYPWQGGVQEGFTRGWPPDIQVIGKDILRFHAIYFPAFLLALDLPLPKTVLSHAHWTMNQMKMSKSIGNVADPFDVLDKYDTDVVRYYLARVGGRFQYDNDWSETQLAKHHQELFSIIGNQLARAFTTKIIDRLPLAEQYISIRPEIFANLRIVAATIKSSIEGTTPTHPEAIPVSAGYPPGAAIHTALQELASKFQFHMDTLEISEALEEVVKCLRLSNREYTNMAPWSSTTPVTTVSRLLSYTRETLRICGILLQPITPAKAEALLNALGVPIEQRALSDATLGRGELPGCHHVPQAVQPVRLFHPVTARSGSSRRRTEKS